MNVDQQNVGVILRDSEREERFRSRCGFPFFSRANVILLMYAVNDKDSFKNMVHWRMEVRRNALQLFGPPLLVANKVDLEDRQVSAEEGKAFAETNGLKYFEISVKTGEGVQEVFDSALSLLPKEKKEEEKKRGACCLLQ